MLKVTTNQNGVLRKQKQIHEQENELVADRGWEGGVGEGQSG